MRRILFLSSLYASPRLPDRSAPNARIVKSMRRFAEMRVVVPLPYYPKALARRPDLQDVVATPAVEIDHDGNEILHPRYAHVPRVGRQIYAGLYATSLLPFVRREVRTFRPEVILTAWAYPDGAAAVGLGEILSVPVVLRCMGSDVNDATLAGARKAQIRLALRRASRVIVVSKAMRSVCEALGASPEKLRVIPTGVDTTVFHPIERTKARALLGIPSEDKVLLVPSRLSPEKGLHLFLPAFAQTDPSWRAILVGNGHEEARLKNMTRELGLESRVTFAGFQPQAQMHLYYAAADLACLPSLEEGWPNVLMESAATGCPWVATDVGGVSEIAELTSGVLAKVDDVADLARAIGVAQSTAWDRAAIAERAATLSLAETGRRYFEVCEEAANTRSSSR